VPTGLTASAQSQTSITLSWTASTDNVGVTGYGRYRDGALVSSGAGTSFVFGGLSCGTSYTLAVDAYDAAGNRSAKASVTAATSACPDTQAPSAPTGLVASNATQSAITLSWNAASDNVGVTGYGRYRNLSLVSSGSATTYTFTGLSCGTSYALAVDAYDAVGNRSAKSSISATTTGCPPDSSPPSTPAGLAQSSGTQTSITLSWGASSDNVGVTGYTVYNGASAAGTTTATSFTVSGLTCGTAYTLAVDAFDAAGNRSGKASITASTATCPDTVPPSVPANFVASLAATTSITLVWNASLDNVGVAGYTVYSGGSSVATTAATTFTVSGLACGTGYTLAVDAYDAAGNHSAKATISASTSACPPPPPPPPSSGAQVFLAPGGSDSNPCTQAQPCQSFDRGYHKASPGQTVEVAAGSYGDQTINDDPSKDGAAAEVLIRPGAGASVTITDLVSYASNVHYKDFTVSTATAGQPDIRDGDNVTVENIKASNFYIQGPTNNVTIKGGDYGPYPSCGGGSQIKTLTNGGDDPNPAAQPKNTVIDGVYMHDYSVPGSCPSAHLDCLHVFYHAGITIRNSTFMRCAHYGILLGSNGASATDNDLIENNFFGDAGVAGFALRGGTDEYFDGVTVRYNSGGIITPQTVQSQLSNIKWYANVAGDLGACRPGIDYQYNISPTGGCGSTDLTAPTGFVSAALGDFHLLAGAAAIGRGKPGDYPATDHDGQPRPQGSGPDAGADER
jgi:chitodextrinase